MFLKLWIGLFVLLKFVSTMQEDENSPCSGLGCRKTVSMPLLDQMKGTLKADFDMSEMNKLIKAYIDQEIRSGVEIGLKNDVENMINLKMQQVQQVSKKYAFFATLSSSKFNLPANTVVIFDMVSLNEGDAYNGTEGKFTSPEDGLYHFSWTTVSSTLRDFTSVLVANDRKIAENVVDSDSVTDYMTGTSNVIVRMTKGETAWIAVQGDQGSHLDNSFISAPCSMFSGFKL